MQPSADPRPEGPPHRPSRASVPAHGGAPASAGGSLVLSVSQDAWLGDAAYTVSFDGVQVGGVRTASASHGAGGSSRVVIEGLPDAPGTHRVTVSFLNDAWGGTPQTDRNLYVDGASFDGAEVRDAAHALYSAGSYSFDVQGGLPDPAPPAPHGYALEGPSWASRTVTWSFAASTYAEDAAIPFSSPIADAQRPLVHAAMDAWSSASGLSLVQVPDAPSRAAAADIRVGSAYLGTPATNVVGYDSYRYDPAMRFLPDSVIRLEDPSENAIDVGPDGVQRYRGFDTTVMQVVLHEVGHALGLAHSSDPTAVMHAILGPQDRAISADDLAGIRAIYGAPGAASASSAPHAAAYAAYAPRDSDSVLALPSSGVPPWAA